MIYPGEERQRESILEGARWNGREDKASGKPMSKTAYDYDREARQEYEASYKEGN